ncbi:MAG: hypothetical protein C5B55_07280 [Blastocatellia bacterium]|nr:MAG: hypothetical protein C5B55_07280 [Blastocatellia bacterium]
MKRCPSCNRTYTDASLNFCLEDGTPLALDAPPPSMPGATVRYPPARDTAAPPPTEIFRPDSPLISQPPPPPQQQWAPAPIPQPQKKSSAIWWILGGLAAFAVIGIGAAVLIFMVASISSTNTNNGNANANSVVSNRNANANANSNANTNSNTNTSNLPSEFTDDFSQQKWGTGESKFGRIWYADDEYHMSSKAKTYVAIYAPSQQYQTANATIKVTGRSVDGSVPSAGFGLMIHCAKSKDQQLEDYALLIYPSDDPEYEIIMHKNGTQSSLVTKTKSSAIRSGTSPNQFEVRVKGTDMAFYINGQLLTHVNDSENYKGGVAGLYTSDATEVAFDDLEITRNKD